jgi:hypothetical protein
MLHRSFSALLGVGLVALALWPAPAQADVPVFGPTAVGERFSGRYFITVDAGSSLVVRNLDPLTGISTIVFKSEDPNDFVRGYSAGNGQFGLSIGQFTRPHAVGRGALTLRTRAVVMGDDGSNPHVVGRARFLHASKRVCGSIIDDATPLPNGGVLLGKSLYDPIGGYKRCPAGTSSSNANYDAVARFVYMSKPGAKPQVTDTRLLKLTIQDDSNSGERTNSSLSRDGRTFGVIDGGKFRYWSLDDGKRHVLAPPGQQHFVDAMVGPDGRGLFDAVSNSSAAQGNQALFYPNLASPAEFQALPATANADAYRYRWWCGTTLIVSNTTQSDFNAYDQSTAGLHGVSTFDPATHHAFASCDASRIIVGSWTTTIQQATFESIPFSGTGG